MRNCQVAQGVGAGSCVFGRDFAADELGFFFISLLFKARPLFFIY